MNPGVKGLTTNLVKALRYARTARYSDSGFWALQAGMLLGFAHGWIADCDPADRERAGRLWEAVANAVYAASE